MDFAMDFFRTACCAAGPVTPRRAWPGALRTGRWATMVVWRSLGNGWKIMGKSWGNHGEVDGSWWNLGMRWWNSVEGLVFERIGQMLKLPQDASLNEDGQSWSWAPGLNWCELDRGWGNGMNGMNGMMTYHTGWWFGTFFIFPYIGNNHPNWLIFFRGVETTNQYHSSCSCSDISFPSPQAPADDTCYLMLSYHDRAGREFLLGWEKFGEAQHRKIRRYRQNIGLNDMLQGAKFCCPRAVSMAKVKCRSPNVRGQKWDPKRRLSWELLSSIDTQWNSSTDKLMSRYAKIKVQTQEYI